MIPKNCVILGNNAFDFDFVNNEESAEVIRQALVNSNNNVFIVTASGEIIDNVTFRTLTEADVVARVGNKLFYTSVLTLG